MGVYSYLDWLTDQVEYFVNGDKHRALFRELYEIDYKPILMRDRNRLEDGLNLRNAYYDDLEGNCEVIAGNCSFLEFLVSLAKKMSYIYSSFDEDRTADCFWTMLENLGVEGCDDPDVIRYAADTVMNRTFSPDGSGGLFPLQHPKEDQRNVEVWYQMNQYLTEVMKNEGRL